MKKIAMLILFFLLAGCAGTNIISKEFSARNIVHYSELDKLESTSDLTNYAVYLDKGDQFPLEISLDTNIIGIADEKINVAAKQKLFFMLKMPENLSKEKRAVLQNLNKEKLSEMSKDDKRKFFANFMVYISKDAKAWAPISDIKSIKKVFGSKSKGGTISFGIGMTREDGIRSYLDVKEAR